MEIIGSVRNSNDKAWNENGNTNTNDKGNCQEKWMKFVGMNGMNEFYSRFRCGGRIWMKYYLFNILPMFSSLKPT